MSVLTQYRFRDILQDELKSEVTPLIEDAEFAYNLFLGN